MPDLASSKDALLTEHFRYTPLSLIDDIINTVNAIIYHALQAIETGLLSTPPSVLGFGATSSSKPHYVAKHGETARTVDNNGDSAESIEEQARDEIENGVHRLETLLEATVDKTFDKFEIYTLRNILTVPDDLLPHVRLAHYEDLELPLPSSSPTPDSITALRHRLQASQRMNIRLRAQYAQNAELITQLHTILGPSPSSAGHNVSKPITTAPLAFLTQARSNTIEPKAQFVASQLPALRNLLVELRPKISTLPSTFDGMDWNTEAEERREYVDGTARRILRTEGLISASGDAMDVDSEGNVPRGDRRKGVDEVRDLERIIGGDDRMET
ncbi:hypothetical protein MMC25_003960 [Agyrium rufum]|nr:hypothetical protein [Agyrium rufum]